MARITGDVLARGLAGGVQQATGYRQAIMEQLGQAKVQKARDVSYQRFQQALQEEQLTQQRELAMQRIEEQQREFDITEERANRQLTLQEKEQADLAAYRKANAALAQKQFDLEKFNTNIGYLQGLYSQNLRKLSEIDPLQNQADWIQTNMTLDKLGQGITNLMANYGKQAGLEPAAQTMRGMIEEQTRIRQEKMNLVRAARAGFREIGVFPITTTTGERSAAGKLTRGIYPEKYRQVTEGVNQTQYQEPEKTKRESFVTQSNRRALEQASEYISSVIGPTKPYFGDWDIESLRQRAVWDPNAREELNRRMTQGNTLQERQMSGAYNK